MLIVGTFHLIIGAGFFFFTGYAVDLFIQDAGPASPLIVKGLSGICFAFGGMNLMARKSPESAALSAVLTGTLFYLLFTVGCDVYWILAGLLKPLAWPSIGIRLAFAGGYAYQLAVRKKEV